jgi:polyhydroxyalkanoate synthesis repressor PhaR
MGERRSRLPQRKKAVSATRKSAYRRVRRPLAPDFRDFQPMTSTTAPITIKKYANRRLYNTASSAYVTLADLAKMVKSGEDFVVFDAKTNEDITRSVLAQIIFEQEAIQGQSLLPITFLRQLIRFYGDSVQALLPSYLEFSIDRFTGEQQKFREQASRVFGQDTFAGASFTALEELTRKNLAAFSQALGLFTPFAGAGSAAKPPIAAGITEKSDLNELKAQLTEMQRRLDTITEKR